MADLLDDDLLLIQRGGASYKMLGSDLKVAIRPKPINPDPGDVTATPPFDGGTGTVGDPYLITPATCPTVGTSILSSQQIVVANAAPGDFVSWTDNSVGAGSRFEQPVGTVDGSGQWSGQLVYTDTPDSTVDNTVYTGNLQLGTTYFRWVVTQRVIPPLVEDTATTISGTEQVGQTLTAVPGTATGGTAPITYATRWQRSNTGTGSWSDIAGATGTTYLLVAADGNNYVRAVTTATDSTTPTPQTLELPSASSGQIVASVPPVVGAVSLSDSTTGANRFTSEVFPVSAAMTDDGTPVSTKGLKAWVEGALQRQPVSSEIVAVAIDTPSVGETTLTFADATDLVNFDPGDAVEQDDAAASGTVGSVDVGALTMLLSASAGTWSANTGNFVIGPVKTITTTPESDEIVQVDGIDYSGTTTATATSDGNPITFGYGSLANVFTDGVFGGIGVTPAADTTTRVHTYTFNPPLQPTTSLGVVCYSAENAPTSGKAALGFNGSALTDLTIGSGTAVPGFSSPLYAMPGYVAGTPVSTIQYQMRNTLTGIADVLYAFYVDGVRLVDAIQLTLASDKDLVNFAPGDAVNQDDSAASGTVSAVDTGANTIMLSSSTGTWSANTGNYVIGPTKPSQSVRLYCDIDGAGNVSDLQSADPGYIAWTPSGAGPYTGNITFPATLPSGNDPDTDLPAGTTLQVAVQATNTAGTSSANSNIVTPI